jgi:predicted anti-sigma-YlaC factor YlaD
MSCEPWQAAISAIADGEDPGVEPRLLQAHLSRCPSCRDFEAALGSMTAPRLQSAPATPDITRRLVKLNAIADRAGSLSIARVLLAVVAVEVLVLSMRDLVLGNDADAFTHATRHLGAFSFAYGVGLLVVVLRPARARAMLPVAAVLAGALLITAVIDLVSGNIPLIGEATHLPELVSLLLIWLLAVPKPKRAKAAPTSDRGLHAA